MKKCTVAICLDAFKADYLNEKYTPFLYELAMERGAYGRLESILAFIGNYGTIFSGTYPETHNVWTLFHYSPTSSPFRWIKPFVPAALRFDKNPHARRHFRFGVSVLTGIKSYLGGHNAAFVHSLQALAIPFNSAKYFDFSLKKLICEKGSLGLIPTLFDILRETGISFCFVDLPLFHIKNRTRLSWVTKYSDHIAYEFTRNLLRRHKSKFCYLHLHELDTVAHQNGPWSKRSIEKVKQLDYLVKNLIKELREMYQEVNIMIFGDHGMVEVNKTLNISAEIEKSGLKENRDYFVFLDATMARFWFKSEEAKQKVIEVLQDIESGHILVEQDIKKFRIDFPHTKYGELIFLAHSGVLISPNYFQGSDIVKGMHGYDPNNSGLDGALILHSQRIAHKYIGQAKFVDLFPTLLDILRLPTSLKCEGRSVLKSSEKSE